MSFDERKVLVPPYADGRRQASMTIARFVPWGIPEPTGIRLRALSAYLGADMKTVWRWTNQLGIRRYYGPAAKADAYRRMKSRGHLISEEDAARLIVYARVRQGSAAAPQPESSGE